MIVTDAAAGADANGGDAQVGADAPPPLVDAVGRVVDFDFEGEALPASVTPGTGVLTPSQAFAPLGPAGNTFGDTFLRSTTGNTVTVFSDLPPHSAISVGFLFAAIDSLDGTGSFPAGDFMRIDVDGTTIFRESFANATPDQIQSYVPPAGGELARHEDLGFSGPGSFYTDSAYDMGVDPTFQNIAHTAASGSEELPPHAVSRAGTTRRPTTSFMGSEHTWVRLRA